MRLSVEVRGIWTDVQGCCGGCELETRGVSCLSEIYERGKTAAYLLQGRGKREKKFFAARRGYHPKREPDGYRGSCREAGNVRKEGLQRIHVSRAALREYAEGNPKFLRNKKEARQIGIVGDSKRQRADRTLLLHYEWEGEQQTSNSSTRRKKT